MASIQTASVFPAPEKKVCPTVPPLAQAQTFIELLTGSPDTVCDWRIVHPTKKNKTGKALADKKRGTLAQSWLWLQAKNREGFGVYLTIQQTNGQGVDSKDVTALLSCFVDFDPPKGTLYTEQDKAEIIGRLQNSPVPPQIIIDSGRGIHAYFLLQPGQSLADFSQTQKRLIGYYSSDSGVHDLARIMRLPGSVNTKSEPIPVKLLQAQEGPRYTLEQIRAAYPAPVAAKTSQPTPVTYSDTANDLEYGELREMTRKYMRTIAQKTAEGSRHNALRGLVPTIVGRELKPDDAEALVLEFCQLTGLDEDEGLELLAWAQKTGGFTPRLPERKPKKLHKLNTRRSRKVKSELTLEQAVKDLTAYLLGLCRQPDHRFHLLSGTVGMGKTTTLAKVLNQLDREGWPVNEDGTDKQILVLVNNHELAQDFLKLLDFGAIKIGGELANIVGENVLPLYQVQKGRNSENCKAFTVIENSEKPQSYCKMCPHQNRCAFFAARATATGQKVVIAAKQAYFHDNIDLNRFYLVFADEDITSTIIHNKTMSIEDLHKVAQAVTMAQRAQNEAHKAGRDISAAEKLTDEDIKAIKRFLKRVEGDMRADPVPDDPQSYQYLLYGPPELSLEQIEWIEQFFEIRQGQYLKATLFFSLFKSHYRMQVKRGAEPRLHITANMPQVSTALKSTTVVNMDATPIRSILAQFDPIEFKQELKQNLRYWQETENQFSRTALNYDIPRQKAKKLTLESAKQLPGKIGIITFNSDLDAIQQIGLPEDTLYGGWGRDTRGTNRFKDCDTLILKGLFLPNLDSVRRMAKVSKVDFRTLLKEMKDAIYLQAIGRLRGARRETPGNVVILTNNYNSGTKRTESFPLDSEPRPLHELLGGAAYAPEHNISMSHFGETQHSSVFDAKKTPIEPPKKGDFRSVNLSEHVQYWRNSYGFYVSAMSGFYSDVFGLPSDPLQGISKRTYERHIKAVLSHLPEHWVEIAPGRKIKVWGERQAALDYLAAQALALAPAEALKPDELAEAVAWIQEEYKAPLGLFKLQDIAGTVFPWNSTKISQDKRQGIPKVYVKDRIADCDWVSDDWAILVYRCHKEQLAAQMHLPVNQSA